MRMLRLLAAVTLGLGLGWCGAFAWFLATLPAGDGGARDTDGIVALTGGPARLDEAVALLAEKRAKRLLISGVNQETSADELRLALHVPEDLFACCVDLGREARDTVGNAREAADWATHNDFHSLRVVTFAAHMPRSLVELGAAMPPGVELVPHPVLGDRARAASLAARPSAAMSLAYEFTKYVVSLARRRTAGVLDAMPAHGDPMP